MNIQKYKNPTIGLAFFLILLAAIYLLPMYFHTASPDNHSSNTEHPHTPASVKNTRSDQPLPEHNDHALSDLAIDSSQASEAAHIFSSEQVSQIQGEVNKLYQPLFDELTLDVSEKAKVKALIGRQMLATLQHAVGKKYPSSQMFVMGSEGEIDQARLNLKALKQQEQDINDQIEKALSPEDFSKFEYFKDTVPERTYISRINLSLTREFRPLTVDQEQRLIKEANRIRNKPEYLQLVADEDAGANNDVVARYDSELAYNREIEVLESTILTPEQWDILSNSKRFSYKK